MGLPDDFQFSQASLQDFAECHRRFQLRHLMELRWPAAEAEPIEAHEQRMILGQAYHRMVQQWLLGVPEDLIARHTSDPELQRWWQSTLAYRPVESFGGASEQALIRTEYTLSGQVAGYRLMAKYDVVVLLPSGRATILDWKTSAKRTPDDRLRGRLQSRVYPCVLVEAGQALNGGKAIQPASVEMIYWFPEAPQSPARFVYSEEQYRSDRGYLTRLIRQISEMGEADFHLTDDLQKCKYCVFRSYCGRGDEAGDLENMPAEWELQESVDDLTLDFEQISEIEF